MTIIPNEIPKITTNIGAKSPISPPIYAVELPINPSGRVNRLVASKLNISFCLLLHLADLF